MKLALRVFQHGRAKNTRAYRAIDKLSESPELMAQFRAEIKKQYGINPDNLKALLELFLKYAPQIIELILKLVGPL